MLDEAARSTQTLDNNVDLKVDQIDSSFVLAIRNFRVVLKDLNSATDLERKTHISILPLLKVPKESIRFKQIVHDNQVRYSQELVGEDAKKINQDVHRWRSSRTEFPQCHRQLPPCLQSLD